MKAIFSPGSSYHDPHVREYAGWVRILDLYREGLEELGYKVFIPEVDPKLIDQSSTVSKIESYDLVAATQLYESDVGLEDGDIFLGPPGYSLAQMMTLPFNVKKFLYVWNNADWWRDQQLAEEYRRFNQPYDLSPTWRWINTTALEMCDHVIACSPWVKWSHSKVVPEEKISIAFWGVDNQMFTRPEKEPTGFRVLFVGGDPIRKGLGYLLKALDGSEGIELWVVGCRPLTIVGPNGSKPDVQQFGMVPHSQVPAIMRQCHVICIPTLEDGIACALQEGMASGLVPIGTPEVAEVFEPGVSGFRVPYGDVEGIRNALVTLRDNPDLRRKMSIEARRLAESQTWGRTKEEFKRIISAGV